MYHMRKKLLIFRLCFNQTSGKRFARHLRRQDRFERKYAFSNGATPSLFFYSLILRATDSLCMLHAGQHDRY